MKMCWLFHKWSKWETFREGKILLHSTTQTGMFFQQERECEVCGKRQVRTERQEVV
jgi:hypothetical protein